MKGQSMLNIVFSGKRRQFESLDQMLRKLGVTVCNSDRGIIRKAERTGDVLYAEINPFVTEMSNGQTQELVFAESEEAVAARAAQLREEV
jgi:hypothetical protein